MFDLKQEMVWTGVAVWLLSAAACSRPNEVAPRLVLIDSDPAPVLSVRTPDAQGNRYGFEGGRVVKLEDGYHLFTSEMAGDPVWVKMRLAHWTSPDGVRWHRNATLFESSGNDDGTDPRAALWSPLPVFDPDQDVWNLFYVAYRAAPNTDVQFRVNQQGRIWRAVSETPGQGGIGGPYRDVGVVLQPDDESEPWEGLQGTDSFFPYRVGESWYALYGSAHSETRPIRSWLVGLAAAPALAGPWKRRAELNPVPIEKVFIENPIVLHDRSGTFLAVYDNQAEGAIGYSFSSDGLNWHPGRSLKMAGADGTWAADIRTPLGLVPEERNVYTVFFTGFETPPDWDQIFRGKMQTTCAVGRARVRLVWEPVNPYKGTSQ